MRFGSIVLGLILWTLAMGASARADVASSAASYVAAIKCYSAGDKTLATTSVVAAPYAAVGKQCGSAAWIVVVKQNGSGWSKVNDTLTAEGQPNSLAIPGVPRDVADALWSLWQKWGADQDATPGTHNDRAALRALATQPGVKIPQVIVVGDWAMLEWIQGESGGEQLWHRVSRKWQVVAGGGGAMDPTMVSAFGVPYGIALKLMPH